MELNEFIRNFAEQFEDTPADAFNADTVFHDLDEWSSMTGLAVIGMIDEQYGVTVKGDVIRGSDTIGDLFNAVRDLKGRE